MNYIEPNEPDELRWYRIQSNHIWYAVKSCCRRCATKKLLDYTNVFTGIAEELPDQIILL